MYDPSSSIVGLLGHLSLLGTTSVVTMYLMRVTDDPGGIAKFVVLNLPVADLVSDTNGEL